MQQAVASGKYATTDEVYVAGLRLLFEREREENALRRKIAEGISDLDGGASVALADDDAVERFFAAALQQVLRTSGDSST